MRYQRDETRRGKVIERISKRYSYPFILIVVMITKS